MDRTSITKHLAGLLNRRTFLSLTSISLWSTPSASGGSTPRPDAVRPGSPQWPDAQAWSDLSARVGGRLAAVSLPKLAPEIAAKRLADPVFIGSEPGLTQSAGWVDAWQSAPSAYVLKARDAADVVQAVNFARHRQVRLVVRGGGHSYHGTSNAPDSLLVWTRAMNQIVLHDAFVPAGLPRAPAPAVSVGAGCTWGEVYTAVTTKGGRYVQGGGCTTVGVAGMLQGGGFGNFSKAFGLAAAHLLEAEIVTADGAILVVNAGRHPDLFWALKGGGGGTFGVVTRVTLETHDLPVTFGAVRLTLQATTDADFQRLLARFIAHYRDALCNPHWGEVVQATADNRLVVEMVFQGLDEAVARSAWKDLVAFAEREPQAFRVLQPLQVFALPARHFWNFAYLSERLPGAMSRGEGSDARGGGFYWTG